MRFCVTTLGCKANQYDTGTIVSILTENGHVSVKPGEGCDVCIINTCAVTAESVRKSRQTVRKMKKLEPGALVAVCGCHIKFDGKEAVLLGADLTGGTNDREEFANRIVEAVRATAPGRQRKHVGATAPGRPQKQITRTRALLKIQDGCDNYCAYCIIPYIRGSSKSMPLNDITQKAKKLQEQGYKEIVITGIEISSWGKDLTPKQSLITAIKAISAATPQVRLRLGSLDPQVLSGEFIQELTQIPGLCNHFHISLQSGCDETLKRMGRSYKTTEILKAITLLRSKFADCAVTADLIMGFPGETDREYTQTLNFIQEATFSDMHVFPYSIRPGTAAESLPGHIEKEVRQKRAREVSMAAKKMKSEFMKSQIGKTKGVLFEEQKGNCSIGHSSNYLKIATLGKVNKNIIKNVLISSIKNGVLLGEIV